MGIYLVGSCPSGELALWEIVLTGSCLDGEVLPWWVVIRVGVVQWELSCPRTVLNSHVRVKMLSY